MTCAEVVAFLLRHGRWYISAIELDVYDIQRCSESNCGCQNLCGEQLERIAREAYEQETGNAAPRCE